MKAYHSIPDDYASYYGRKCLAFYKYDGSNMRFLWTAKQGWSRFGTRNNLIDKDTPLYGQAVEIFNEKYKDRLTWLIRNDKMFQNIKEVMAFCEFFGPSSFAGQHKLEEKKELVLFDINIGTRGFMDPFTFRDKLKAVDTAKVVYEGILTEDFAKQVRQSGLPTERQPLFEGVIAKGGENHKLWMVKIKSRTYVEQLTKRQDEINNWIQ
jgi:RNA ligase